MKQLIVVALVALGLAIVVPTALPAAGDPQGPPCSNITNGDGGYSALGVIDFTVFLQAPACSRPVTTYSFFVTDTSGTAITLVNATQDSNCVPEPGGGCVHFVYEPTGSPSTVCIYATTDIHGHLVDRAPNASQQGCPASSPSFILVKGVSPGGGGFN